MGKKLGQCVDIVAGVCTASYIDKFIKNATWYKLTGVTKIGYYVTRLIAMDCAGTITMRYSKKLRNKIGEMIFKEEEEEYGED